ncbi:C40 family peptidase [Kitasatospora purpeofusca]|uniref:C40 family peptidase n=1 Tax=Kitasatospora purpeofusca TaxID=67352 RepID=UPI00224CF5F2|nr:bifunctional lytic transglycosylase/C40 family peptidase [Kitasatospora purpeofusca]MCX4753700.1 bifunctional lytic transglycosylase/C40 family peptidase [Kitasatospora purpeofusca]WSR37282.1 bifunctional lytic transglycosylase/C40 family peptidase [Kitasatospora purpeofusca]
MVLRKGATAAAAAGVVAVGFIGLVTFGTYAASGTPQSQGNAAGLSPGTVPAAYQGPIEQWGRLCPDLSPPLLAAQLYQESGFDPRARSGVGAEGLAQFIPGTWAAYGTDGNNDGRKDPWEPLDAIASAATFDCALATLVGKVPGDRQSNMLAAYNAGPGAVTKYQGVPPYRETQGYVRNILATSRSFAAPVAPGAPVEVSAQSAGAIYFAQDKLGTPYLWGGDGLDSQNGRFDCSGLTKAAFESVGILLPRVANDQWYAGPHPSRDQLRPGDLVFWATDLTDPRSIHHVGIYVGGGYMINAPHTGAVIRYDKIDTKEYIGATRVTSDAAQALPNRNADGGVIAPSRPGDPAPTPSSPATPSAPAAQVAQAAPAARPTAAAAGGGPARSGQTPAKN